MKINSFSLPAERHVLNFFFCVRRAVDCSDFDCSGYGTVVRWLIAANFIVVFEIVSVDH